MYEVYMKAAAGDLAYFRKWLTNPVNRNQINKPWDGSGSHTRDDVATLAEGSSIMGIGLTGWFLCAATTVSPPLGFVLMLVAAAAPIVPAGIVLSYHDNYKNNHNNWTLLQFAAESGNIALAQLLLDHGANRIGANGKTFIDIAESAGQKKFVEKFIRREAKQPERTRLDNEVKLWRSSGKKIDSAETTSQNTPTSWMRFHGEQIVKNDNNADPSQIRRNYQ